ncbi:diaminopimelate epimerase [bacterium]|nr:diaminopimelate epimerase [bacterium]
MALRFSKYQAAGNDFVILEAEDFEKIDAKRLCDRHLGIGADGILVNFKPADPQNDAKMVIVNSDGTTAEMCGNGLRCFAAYLASERGMTANPLKIETGNGTLDVKLEDREGRLYIQASLGKSRILFGTQKIVIKERELSITGISMGNPHVVVFVKSNDIDKHLMASRLRFDNPLGYEANAEIVSDINQTEKSADVIVCERGVGFTLGCGTGGAAVMRSLSLNGFAHKNEAWRLNFPGGTIEYVIAENDEILIGGIPEKCFEGIYEPQ